MDRLSTSTWPGSLHSDAGGCLPREPRPSPQWRPSRGDSDGRGRISGRDAATDRPAARDADVLPALLLPSRPSRCTEPAPEGREPLSQPTRVLSSSRAHSGRWLLTSPLTWPGRGRGGALLFADLPKLKNKAGAPQNTVSCLVFLNDATLRLPPEEIIRKTVDVGPTYDPDETPPCALNLDRFGPDLSSALPGCSCPRDTGSLQQDVACNGSSSGPPPASGGAATASRVPPHSPLPHLPWICGPRLLPRARPTNAAPRSWPPADQAQHHTTCPGAARSVRTGSPFLPVTLLPSSGCLVAAVTWKVSTVCTFNRHNLFGYGRRRGGTGPNVVAGEDEWLCACPLCRGRATRNPRAFTEHPSSV